MKTEHAKQWLQIIDGKTALEHRLGIDCKTEGKTEGNVRHIYIENPPNRTVLKDICALTGNLYKEMDIDFWGLKKPVNLFIALEPWETMESYHLNRHAFIPPPEGCSREEWESSSLIYGRDGSQWTHYTMPASYIVGCMIDDPSDHTWNAASEKVAAAIVTRVKSHPRNRLARVWSEGKRVHAATLEQAGASAAA